MSLSEGGEGAEVGPGKQLEEDVVAKDIDKGGQREVVIGGQVGIGDGENGEGGAVREIHDKGCGEGKEGDEQEL